MTTLDDALLPAVLEILDEFGKPLSYIVRTGTAAGTYDRTTGKVSGHTPPTVYSVKSLPPGNYRHYFGEGTVLKDGDLQTGVAGSGLAFSPETASMLQITIDGRAWTVENVMPVYSGESVCLWLFNCRGGT